MVLSSIASRSIACSFVSPHISSDGISDAHTAGRSGRPNSLQRLSSVNCTHRTPAGLLMPLRMVMPGIGDEIDGAMQQAPQPGRQFIGWG